MLISFTFIQQENPYSIPQNIQLKKFGRAVGTNFARKAIKKNVIFLGIHTFDHLYISIDKKIPSGSQVEILLKYLDINKIREVA